jgi:two-component system, response regulator PdtaR
MNSPDIVVVEDDALLAWALSAQLEDLGYRVIGTAATAEQAVASVLGLAPDIVLMDIRLAGEGTGLDAARRIRELSDVPILFCSSYADVPGTADEVQAVGNALLTGKPVTGAELRRRLADLLEESHAPAVAVSGPHELLPTV